MKKILLTIILIIWMIIIYSFSNQNGTDSENLSDEVTIKVIDASSTITKKEYTSKEKESIVSKYRVVIRKGAHITLYLILGIISYLTIKNYNEKNKIIFSLIFCILYALTDELHQSFSVERSAKLTDVFIDFGGSLLGVFLINLYYNKILAKFDNSDIITGKLKG